MDAEFAVLESLSILKGTGIRLVLWLKAYFYFEGGEGASIWVKSIFASPYGREIFFLFFFKSGFLLLVRVLK